MMFLSLLSLLSPAPRLYPDPSLACVIDAEIASSWLALADGDCADPHTVDGDFSVDLGKRSVASLQILADGVALDGAEPCVTWDELQRIAQKKGGAWQLFRGYEPKRIEGHSELTQRTASLYPTPGGAPPTRGAASSSPLFPPLHKEAFFSTRLDAVDAPRPRTVPYTTNGEEGRRTGTSHDGAAAAAARGPRVGVRVGVAVDGHERVRGLAREDAFLYGRRRRRGVVLAPRREAR